MATASKTDLKAELPGYRAVRGRFDVLTVPPTTYLMADGEGDPNSAPAYAQALAALYPVAYALKFLSKRELGRDYVVPPLEGLWWAEDAASFTTARDKTRWRWTLMIRVPDWLTDDHVAQARETAGAKGAAIGLVRCEELDEGLCIQTLHVGSYDSEGPVLAEMHDRVIPGRGLRMTGIHHEIYLSDARRTAPERLRTILRQPVAEIPADAP